MSQAIQTPQVVKQFSSQGGLDSLDLPESITNPSTESLLARGHTTDTCSDLHRIVFAFRKAHGIDPERDPHRRLEIISLYPLGRAAPSEREAIRAISTPSEYVDLRHGGRAQSPYPPLNEAVIKDLCREISAALVWRSLLDGAVENSN